MDRIRNTIVMYIHTRSLADSKLLWNLSVADSDPVLSGHPDPDPVEQLAVRNRIRILVTQKRFL